MNIRYRIPENRTTKVTTLQQQGRDFSWFFYLWVRRCGDIFF